MSKSKKKQGSGAGCMTLFGLPFAGISVFTSWMLGSMLWLGYASSSWEEVPADITSIQIETHRGEDNDTYSVVAEYRYSYRGQDYIGDRVGLSGKSDSFEAYHKKLLKRLKQAQAKDRAVCYVDPQNPDQALLDRTLRPMLAVFMLPFILAFGGVGFGLIAGAVYASKKGKSETKLQEAAPDSPWLWREDWKQGIIRSSNKMSMWLVGVFTFMWCSISFPLAAVFYLDDKNPDWWVKLILMLFPAIGIGFIGYFVYLLLRQKKYGRSVFRLAHTPGVLGGRLTGVVMAPALVANAESIQIKLVCSQTVRSGDSNRVNVLWQDERVLNQTLTSDEPGRIGVPIVFTIPSDKKATDSEDSIAWSLSVKAATKGIDYDEEFEVPVFLTEDSQDGVEIDEQPLSECEAVIPLSQLLAKQGIVVEELAARDSVRYTSPIGRNKGTSFGLTLFTMIWLGAVYFAVMNAPWIFGVVFGLFGFLLMFFCLDCWLGCSELSIEGERWTARSGWYGLRGAGRTFSSSDIKAIVSEQRMGTGSGSNQTQWNNLIAELHPVAGAMKGKKIPLVRYVLNGASDRQLLADLRRRAGIGKASEGEPSTWDFADGPADVPAGDSPSGA